MRWRRSTPPAAILFVAIAALAGCSEEESPVGFDEGPRGPVGTDPVTVVVGSPSADVALRASRTTGSAKSVLVGSDETSVARGYFRFASVPDTAGVDRALIRVRLRHGRGEPVDLAMREVLGAKGVWSAADITWENAPDARQEVVSLSPMVPTASVVADTTDSIDFALPMRLVRLWKTMPDSNAGVVLSAESMGGTARIFSRDDVLYGVTYRIETPALILQDQAGTELSRALATEDAYVIRDLRPTPAGSDSIAEVTSGPPSRVLLRFDMDEVPAGASVVRATLRMPFVGLHGSGDGSVPLISYRVIDDWTEDAVADTTRLGSAASTVEVAADSLVAFEIGPLVQSWLQDGENRGVAVRMSDEISTMDGLGFGTRESAHRKPTLTVTYVPMQDPRWTEVER